MSSKLLGNTKQGKLFVVSAPSGTGKTTLVNRLCNEFDVVVRTITCTTRKKRAGDVDGVDYHFLTQSAFENKEKAGEFLETATVYEDKYGTLKESVTSLLNGGKHVVLVIDTQGADQVRKVMPEATLIFIAPPSLDELKRRLMQRNTETSQNIDQRLKWARTEIEKGRDYDYLIVNDDLEIAYKVLRSIFIAEEHHLRRNNAAK